MSTMSAYAFGTMSIGRDPSRIRHDISLARDAMEAGVSFHTSHRYSSVNNYNVLRRAFREAPDQVPPCICKIRCYNADTIRCDVEDTLLQLELDTIHVAQLSRRSGESKKDVVEDFLSEGPMWEACMELREAGLVGDYFLELFVSCSREAVRAVEQNLFDGYAFYYSVVDREVTNELARMLREREEPIISIRTVGGGKIFPGAVDRMRREEPDHYYLDRISDLEPIYERSESRDWLDFALRFLLSQPNVCTTVGGTASKEHLEDFVESVAGVRPLPAELVEEIHGLHDEWMTGF